LLAPIAKTAATRTKRIAGMFETLAKLRTRRA